MLDMACSVGDNMQKNLLQAIENIVKGRFPDASILKVDIQEDEGADGDRVLNVTVIFEADRGAIDPREAAGIVRHVRPKLREYEETGFPIFSFISSTDMAAVGASA